MVFLPDMEVFRISKKAFSAVDGTGGLYYSGRWHHTGQRVVYTAQHRSLAALEALVHVSKTQLLLKDFILTTIYIPDDLAIQEIELIQLREDWNIPDNIYQTQSIGNMFLQAISNMILKVPSAIIEDEYNFILNPVHPDFNRCKITKQQSFGFDCRLVIQ